jgi:hypothetical protein
MEERVSESGSGDSPHTAPQRKLQTLDFFFKVAGVPSYPSARPRRRKLGRLAIAGGSAVEDEAADGAAAAPLVPLTIF